MRLPFLSRVFVEMMVLDVFFFFFAFLAFPTQSGNQEQLHFAINPKVWILHPGLVLMTPSCLCLSTNSAVYFEGLAFDSFCYVSLLHTYPAIALESRRGNQGRSQPSVLDEDRVELHVVHTIARRIAPFPHLGKQDEFSDKAPKLLPIIGLGKPNKMYIGYLIKMTIGLLLLSCHENQKKSKGLLLSGRVSSSAVRCIDKPSETLIRTKAWNQRGKNKQTHKQDVPP